MPANKQARDCMLTSVILGDGNPPPTSCTIVLFANLKLSINLEWMHERKKNKRLAASCSGLGEIVWIFSTQFPCQCLFPNPPTVVHPGYMRCDCLLLEDHACILTPTVWDTGMEKTSWHLFVALDSSLLCCVSRQEFFITCLNWTTRATTR